MAIVRGFPSSNNISPGGSKDSRPEVKITTRIFVATPGAVAFRKVRETGVATPEDEADIAKEPALAMLYVKEILKGKLFPAAEPYFAENSIWSYDYAIATKQRFLLGEERIKRSGFSAFYAAQFIGRWPEAEPYILMSEPLIFAYCTMVLKDRWQEGEDEMLRIARTTSSHIYSATCLTRYALEVVQGRWYEAEDFMKEEPGYWAEYRRRFIITGPSRTTINRKKILQLKQLGILP